LSRAPRFPMGEAVVNPVPRLLTSLGRCRTEDPELFYAEDEQAVRQAVALCQSCPVMKQCLDYALDNEEFGVWGGATESERSRLRTKPLVSPEVRRHHEELMAALASGTRTLEELGVEFDCSVRTLQRRRKELHGDRTKVAVDQSLNGARSA